MKNKVKICRRCKGSGIDPDTHYRYTSGGHDDRSCKECNGEGITESSNGRIAGFEPADGGSIPPSVALEENEN